MSRGLNSACLPEHVRRLMPQEAKRDLGRAAETMPEIQARQAVKLEKELHAQFEQWLRMKGIPFGTSRMDRKSSFSVGWPDYTLCINGRAVFCELKCGANDLDPDQIAVRNALVAAGAVYRVCRSLLECIETVREVKSPSDSPPQAEQEPSQTR